MSRPLPLTLPHAPPVSTPDQIIAQRASQAYHRAQYTQMLAAAKQQGFHFAAHPQQEGYTLPPLPSIMQLHSKFACQSRAARAPSLRLPNPIHFTDDTHSPRLVIGDSVCVHPFFIIFTFIRSDSLIFPTYSN